MNPYKERLFSEILSSICQKTQDCFPVCSLFRHKNQNQNSKRKNPRLITQKKKKSRSLNHHYLVEKEHQFLVQDNHFLEIVIANQYFQVIQDLFSLIINLKAVCSHQTTMKEMIQVIVLNSKKNNQWILTQAKAR